MLRTLGRTHQEPHGSYNVASSRIIFNRFSGKEYRIPFGLSKKAFRRMSNDIQDALTHVHESIHFVQFWSTTYGILEYMMCCCSGDLILRLIRLGFKPPFGDLFLKLFSHLLNKPHIFSSDDNTFIDYMLTLKLLKNTKLWIQGLLSPNKVNVYDIVYWPNREKAIYHLLDIDISPFNISIPPYSGLQKKYPLISISKWKSKNTETFLEGIGFHHLIECFARSVEFELILNFNYEIGTEIIKSWTDDNITTDNLPFRLMILVAEEIWPHNHQFQFHWAHLRIFIDIALMYSDFLNFLPDQFSDQIICNKIIEAHSHPGITFFRVLKAFGKCTPLKNHDEDILRLYDDILEVMNLPTLDQMLDRFINILKFLCEQEYVREGLWYKYLKTAISIIEWKRSDPLLFINDLIQSDRRSQLLDKMKQWMPIYYPQAVQERNDMPSIILEVLHDYCDQVIVNNELHCPFDKFNNLNKIRICSSSARSGSECEACFLRIKNLVKIFD